MTTMSAISTWAGRVAQKFHVVIGLICPLAIPMKAHETELGFHQPGIHGADLDAGAEQVHLHPFGQCFHGMFGRTVDVAVRVHLMAGDGSDIDHVT